MFCLPLYKSLVCMHVTCVACSTTDFHPHHQKSTRMLTVGGQGAQVASKVASWRYQLDKALSILGKRCSRLNLTSCQMCTLLKVVRLSMPADLAHWWNPLFRKNAIPENIRSNIRCLLAKLHLSRLTEPKGLVIDNLHAKGFVTSTSSAPCWTF